MNWGAEMSSKGLSLRGASAVMLRHQLGLVWMLVRALGCNTRHRLVAEHRARRALPVRRTAYKRGQFEPVV